MPPSDALGLGGQGIGDFLSLSDTPTLRKKYYDSLQGGLDQATQPAQPDQNNLLWQGIVPSLAIALLTKGKSLGFSGAPMLNVLQNEQKRADDEQNLSINAKLKGAGLFGEELGRRETLAASTANKEEDRQARKDIADQASQDRLSIAAQASADRRFAAEQSGADRDEARKDRQDKTAADQAERFGKDLQTDLQDRKFKDRYEALQSAKSALSQAESGNGIALTPLKEAITRYYITGGRQAVNLINQLVPSSAHGDATKALNYVQGTTDLVASPSQLKGLKALIDGADMGLSSELGEVANSHKARLNSEAPLAAKRGGMDVYTDPTKMGYSGLSHLNDILPTKQYTTPSGAVISGAEALQRYSNNSQALGLLQEVK